MCQPYGGFGLVDMLSAGTARFAGLKYQVCRVDFNLHVFRLRQNRNGYRGGLNSALRFGDRDALYAMHAAFVFKAGISARSFHHEDDFFESTKLCFVCIQKGEAKAAFLRIHGVHAVEHSGKERRFLASSTGADFYHDVFLIVGILGQKHECQRFFGFGKLFFARTQLIVGKFQHILV